MCIRDRHRLGRRGRGADRGTALRRRTGRAPGTRRGAGQRGQPGRRLQRADRAERAVPAEGDPAGARERPPEHRGRRRGRGARHGHHARGPDRGECAARDIWRGPHRRTGLARIGEVEPRAHAGRGRDGRSDEDGRGDPARDAAQDAARGHAVTARGLGARRCGAADRGAAVAGDRPSAPGRHLGVRCERHQLARHHRAGAGLSLRTGIHFCGRRGGSPAAVGC